MYKSIISVIFIVLATTSYTNGEQTQPKNAVTCQLCTFALKAAENLIQNNATDQKVLEFIENNLCGLLGPYEATCQQLITTYGPVILADLANKVDPSVICKKIGFCTGRIQVQEPKNAVTCQLCTFVFSTAENLVQNNATDQKILNFIENNLCGLLGPYEATCKQLITAFGPEILADLANKVDPATICKKIGLCTSSGKSLPKASPLTPKSLNCTICKLVMTEVQMQLKSNASEQQILNFIEGKLCDLAGPLAPLCKAAIDSFGPQILTMLANNVDPEKVCEFLQMCSSSTTHHRLDFPRFKPTLKENPVLCTVCQYVVEFLDTQLRANKTEEALLAALDEVCKIAPSSIRNECNNLVNQYGIYLVQLLTEFADPLKVCRLATLC